MLQNKKINNFKLRYHSLIAVNAISIITLAQEPNLLALFSKNATSTTTLAPKAYLLAVSVPKFNKSKGNCKKTILSLIHI